MGTVSELGKQQSFKNQKSEEGSVWFEEKDKLGKKIKMHKNDKLKNRDEYLGGKTTSIYIVVSSKNSKLMGWRGCIVNG